MTGKSKNTPLVYGHRGASGECPENTAAAFAEAWKQEADGIECDIHLTRDGELAVLHDPHTGRIAGRKLVVADMPWAGLRDLDVGSWKDPRFAAERIPLLRDVLDAMPARPKVVRAWLRQRGVGTLTLKKRGVALDPDRFRQETGKVTGDSAATLVLTTISGAATAIALG